MCNFEGRMDVFAHSLGLRYVDSCFIGVDTEIACNGIVLRKKYGDTACSCSNIEDNIVILRGKEFDKLVAPERFTCG